MRNGSARPRRRRLTAGPITVRRPRVRGLSERVVRRVLPRGKRRTREVGERLPPLSRQGRAWGDVDLALRGLLGDAAPLSPAAVTRLKAPWQLEEEVWKPRRLEDVEVVDVWADGLEGKAGLEDPKAALLVMLGALPEGQTVGLAVESSQREAKASWGAMRRDLRPRGLQPWRCTMAEGPWGLGAALGEPPPTAAAPRGWNHRLTNGLEAVPTKPQAEARTLLWAMP